jgi:hypothetical protein
MFFKCLQYAAEADTTGYREKSFAPYVLNGVKLPFTKIGLRICPTQDHIADFAGCRPGLPSSKRQDLAPNGEGFRTVR